MHDSVSLRPFTRADQPFLARVYASARVEELAGLPWSDAEREAFVAQQFEAECAHYARHYPEMSQDVVLVDGEPAGRLLVDRWQREIRVVDICLLPEARGEGVGSELLHRLMEEARQARKRLGIQVERSNPALALHRRLGFRAVGDDGVHLRMEWDPSRRFTPGAAAPSQATVAS